MHIRILTSAVLAACLMSSGCANQPGVAPGTDASSVESSSGKPFRVWQEAGGGASWEYPLGPMGRYTYMVRFGADNRVTRVDQVLGQDTFSRIVLGMPMTDVEHLLGRPYSKEKYAATGQTAWAWRYVDTVWRRCFYAYEGQDGRVAGTGSGDEWPGTLGVGLSIPC